MTQVLNNLNQQSNNQGGINMEVLKQNFIDSLEALRVADSALFVTMVTKVYEKMVPQQQPGVVTVMGAEFPTNDKGQVVMEVAAVEAMLSAIKEPQQPVAETVDPIQQVMVNQRVQSLIEQIAILERKITNCMAYGIQVSAETLQLQALKIELDTLMGNNLSGKAINMVNATGQYVNNTIAPVVGSTIQSTGNLVGDLLNGLLDAVQGVVNEVTPVATSIVNSVVPVAGSVVNAGIGVGRVATNLTVNSINSVANTAQQTTQTVGSLFNIK